MCTTWPLYVKRPTGCSPRSARWTTPPWPSRHGFPAGPAATSSPTSPATRTPSSNVFAGRPMYASAEARDADIERDAAARPATSSSTDLRDQRRRLPGHAPRSRPDWSRTVELRNGVTDSAVPDALPALGRGRPAPRRPRASATSWRTCPAEFTEREIDFLAERFAGHPDMPPTGLEVGRRPGLDARAAAPGRVRSRVAGPAAELLGWLAGRARRLRAHRRRRPAPCRPPAIGCSP